MRGALSVFTLLMVLALDVTLVPAARPNQKREQADYVVTGVVTAVYSQETTGYRNFIVEIKVEEVEKGDGIKKGDTFRAFCYKRTARASIQFDTAGHTTVPEEGQRVKAFVNRARGRNEGVYPNWIDILSEKPK